MSIATLKPAFSAAMQRLKVSTITPEASDPIAQLLFKWLGNLKLLHNVPFRYLVPEERMLPPESIKFFHLDMNWVNALLDGAYSIGRYATGLETQSVHNRVEGALSTGVATGANMAARNIRPDIFKAAPVDNAASFEVVTGFLLRSQVVKGWKSLQANAYDKNNYPELPDWNGSSLPMLRFEHLSEEVLIGIFEGEIYRLDLHEPSEGVHFGFDLASSDLLSKKLRDPATGTEIDPSKASLSPEDLNNNQIFRDGGSAGDPSTGNPGGQVLNLYNLSTLLNKSLQAAGFAPGYTEPTASVLINGTPTNVSGLPDTSNPLVSSDFALQMIEGVGMVSFYQAAPGDSVDCGA